MTRPILEARSLSHRYGVSAPEVLRDVTFTIERGELAGIVGPNGAGKSTLLGLLAGFAKPSAGEIALLGRPLGQWRRLDLARKVAYVPQAVPPDVTFTALEVALAGRHPHVGWLGFESANDLAVARRALARLDAARLEDRRLCELSGGEQARVLVARALAQEPELLLLDEPTAFLDVGHRLDLYDRLREENRDRGLTVLVVTHDLNLASEYCGRLLLLDRGALVADGAPSAVLTAERISEVYACRVAVDTNPSTGAPRVTPLPRHVNPA